MTNWRVAWVVAVAGLTAALAAAQDTSQEINKLLAKRAAEADAYRNLAEAVYGLQINSHTYVKDFVTEADDIRAEVDTFVKGVRLGDPIWYEDGSCEVPAEVTVAKVIETLRSAHGRHYDGDRVKTEDFETMKQRIEKNVIRTVGMGAPRPELPPRLPQGVAEMLGPPPADAAPLSIPAIWKTVPAQARMLATRAAELDAKRQLAERIKGLRLTSRTQVRDFTAESDTITTELSATLVGATRVDTYLHDHELIAEVTVRVPTEQVITNITRLHNRLYKGDDLEGHDVEELVKRVVKRDFEATGMGVPPARYLQQYAAETGTELPEWTLGPLEADGEATDPAIDSPQGRLMAARAAELVAKRNLAEQIAGLQLTSATTVRDFITEHDDIDAMVDAVIVDAVVTETRYTEQTALVRVSVPGMRVWEVMSLEIRRRSRP